MELSEEKLEYIIKKIGHEGECSCAIDDDANYWLYFDHGHNLMTISLDVWENGTFVEKNRAKVALTGNWKEDIIYGIKLVLEA